MLNELAITNVNVYKDVSWDLARHKLCWGKGVTVGLSKSQQIHLKLTNKQTKTKTSTTHQPPDNNSAHKTFFSCKRLIDCT